MRMKNPSMRLDKAFVREYIQTYTTVYGDKKCWLLTAATGNNFRYPRRRIDGVYYAVAGLALWAAGWIKQPIPCKVQGKGGLSSDDDLFLHHCDGGELGCVRPDHIFIDDQEENMQDCLRKGRNPLAAKEFCINGHYLNDPLIGRRYKNTPTHRSCLACKRDYDRRIHNRPESAWDGPTLLKMAITKGQLIAAVEACDGDKEKAAPILGITYSTLMRKWHHFGLKVKDRSEWRYSTAPRPRVTHCKRGHPFDEKNTYTYPDGGRGCRECLRLWQIQRDKPKTTVRQRWKELAAELIPLALAFGGGNNTKACELAGLSRTTFERKRRELKCRAVKVFAPGPAMKRLRALRDEMLKYQSEWRKLAAA